MIHIKTVKLSIWQKDPRIEKARKIIIPKIRRSLAHSTIKFDAQDLEHQILFRMTTLPEREAFKKISYIFDEQKAITMERMNKAKIPPDRLFYFGSQRIDHNWFMNWGDQNKKLYALNRKTGERKEVTFREITDSQEFELFSDIIQNYHYIHCSRNKGWLFGMFIKDHQYPFALQEVEPCNISRNYKKAILMLSDINYNTSAEITRFYSIPNSPKNLAGILDKLIGRVLRDRGYEWLMTSVMPCFSKTRATTIAGGVDTPIYAKKLELQFFQRKDGKWEFLVNRHREALGVKTISNLWKLHPVIEMIKPIRKGLDITPQKALYYAKKIE